ncbi:glycosyltransferase [Acetobacter sp. UBA5411]|uniref:glycosyltransferase n=1 Tax=Acetobacter sp. UBA5411 TaxID=1945905 RepID=UPI0025BADE2D|nr:glycosyltransferase [Acetobacter sp. UBA5411]
MLQPFPSVASAKEDSFLQRRRIVAIPACNEAEHIVPCLLALARQEGPKPHKVVLWVNNTQDTTCERALSLLPKLPYELDVVSVTYSPDNAHAGRARRDAMCHATLGAPADALLFTTDADAEVASDWMQKTLEAFSRYNVAAVFGRALLLPDEALKIPAHLHQDDDREQAYGALLEQITAKMNPEPHDPWPRHAEHSGASIAVTHEAWKQVGGIPLTPSGEDRAFYHALRRGHFPVRHSPDVKVYVSARFVGRARGGMAETLARRIIAQDDCIDEALETVSARMLRARQYLSQRQDSRIQDSFVERTVNPSPIRRAELHLHHQRAERVLAFLNRSRAGLPSLVRQRSALFQDDTISNVRCNPLPRSAPHRLV